MYFSENAFSSDVQEIQMAQLLTIISSYMGGKSKIHDFIVRKRNKPTNAVNNDISTASEDAINKLLGVTNG